jgi:hypothetical protein
MAISKYNVHNSALKRGGRFSDLFANLRVGYQFASLSLIATIDQEKWRFDWVLRMQRKRLLMNKRIIKFSFNFKETKILSGVGGNKLLFLNMFALEQTCLGAEEFN